MEKISVKELFEQLLKVSIWGILPLFLLFTISLCMILVKWKKQDDVESPMQEISGKKKGYKAETIYFKPNYSLEIYVFFFVTLALVPFVVWINSKYKSYIYYVLDKIDIVSNVVMGLTTLAITMAAVIILFDKSYYIVFSIRDVLQSYKFAECLVVTIGSYLLAEATTMTLLNEKIDSVFDNVRLLVFEVSVLYNFLSVFYILAVITNIMFLERKKELRLLDKLYRVFWVQKIDTTNFNEKWKKEAVETNIEYLLERYIKICRHKKIAQIERIEFGTTLGCYRKKWYKKANWKFIKVLLVLLLISCGVNVVVLREDCCCLVLINFLVTIAAIGFSFLGVKSFESVVFRLFLDTWGYFACVKSEYKQMIPRVALRINNAYDKYIMRMNSLNAFFYIWVNYENEQENIKDDIEKLLLKGLAELTDMNVASYFPAFTISYFLFIKGIKFERIKEVVNKTVVEKNEKYLFQQMMVSQIFYLTRNFNKQDKSEYKSGLDEYFEWLGVKTNNYAKQSVGMFGGIFDIYI